jgi:adenylate cyclase class 2
MLEIELKFANADFPAVERALAQLGASNWSQREEVDAYFNAPDRDFRQTGEAFRLRRVGPRNFFTYKGPRLPGGVKMRTELEVPLADGPEAAAQYKALLVHLGYRPVAEVRKLRRCTELTRAGRHLQVCLDEVEQLGRFVEIETLAEEERLDEGRQAVLDLAADLGLHSVEQRSYLTLLLLSQSRTGPTLAL